MRNARNWERTSRPSLANDRLNLVLDRFYSSGATLTHQDEQLIQVAIHRACHSLQPTANINDVQDICQDVYIKMIRGRMRFTYSGPLMWRGYVRRCASGCWSVWFQKRDNGVELSQELVGPEVAIDIFSDLVEKTLGETCFGYPEAVPLSVRRHWLWITRQFVWDGSTLEEVRQKAGGHLEAREARQWASNPALLADLAYRILYAQGQDGARSQAVTLRRAQRLRERLGRRAKVLRESGVWRRLAFEYRYVDELTVREIADRLCPLAEAVGYHLTYGMLNMWLSGGRIIRDIRKLLPAADADGLIEVETARR